MIFEREEHRVVLRNEKGEVIAEIDFPIVSEGVVDINHTFVSPTLRGQGVAGKLAEAAVETIRAHGWKMKASCSFAAAWTAGHPEAVADLMYRGE